MAASLAAGAGSRVLADSIGPGGTAAIVVLVLVLASAVIIVAMLGSLKRLRQNASKGTFQQEARKQGRKGRDVVTHDPGGPDGAGA